MPVEEIVSIEVSVILPTFNRKRYIAQAVESVILQDSTRAYEIIVVDDGSTDGTEQLFKNHNFPNLTYIRLPENVGGGAARNKGISVAKGKYIAFIDSDVTWARHKLELQASTLDNARQEIGIVYSAYRKETSVNSGNYTNLPVCGHTGMVLEQILLDNFIDTPTAMVRKSVLDKVGGFDPMLPRFQDWELFIRICQDSEVSFIAEPLIDSRALSDSISANSVARESALLHIFHKHLNLFSKRPVAQGRMLLKIINSKVINSANLSAIRFVLANRKTVGYLRLPLFLIFAALPSLLVRSFNVVRKIALRY